MMTESNPVDSPESNKPSKLISVEQKLGSAASEGADPIKVLFIYPPVRLSAAARYPPFGFLYLGAVLEQAGIKVEIIDLNLLRLKFDDVMRLVDEKEFDVIGIGGMTTVYYYMKLLSLHLKKRHPHIPIMGGGSACSSTPHTVLEKTGIDVVCIGEGEPIVVELVRRLVHKQDLADIPGIVYRDDNGQLHETKKRPRMMEITDLPYPAYHLLDMEHYIKNNAKVYASSPQVWNRVKEAGIDPVRAARPVSLFTKRGCPFGCNFCYRNFGRKVAYSSVDYTLGHMSFLEEKFNTAHFVFNDEIFNVNTKWVTEFCERIISEGRKYILSTNNGLRANVLDREMLTLMKQAGFCQVGIGIESFYDPTLKAMRKGQTAEQVYNALKLTRELGLFINSAQLLFGYETDGRESMEANVKALTELGFSSANFSIPCPYPGTYLYDIAKERGLIVDEEGWLMELADKDISDRVINLSKMTEEEMEGHIQWGLDQLNINQLRSRRPFLAMVLDRVQPFLRKHLNIDAYGTLAKVWSVVRHGRFPARQESASRGAHDEHIREEAFRLLEELKAESRPSLANRVA